VNDRLQILEEKIAYLERHVTEQDKVMLEFSEEITRLRRELLVMRERAAAAGNATDAPMQERPPHY